MYEEKLVCMSGSDIRCDMEVYLGPMYLFFHFGAPYFVQSKLPGLCILQLNLITFSLCLNVFL